MKLTFTRSKNDPTWVDVYPCRRCYMLEYEHAGVHCLFGPTTFEPIPDAILRLLACREFGRTFTPNELLTFHFFETVFSRVISCSIRDETRFIEHNNVAFSDERINNAFAVVGYR